MKSAPAKAAATAAAMSSGAPDTAGLSDDEKTLRDLLELTVNSGIHIAGHAAPMCFKYEKFITSVHASLLAPAEATTSASSPSVPVKSKTAAAQSGAALMKPPSALPPRLLSKSAPTVGIAEPVPTPTAVMSPPPPPMIPAPSAALRGASSKVPPHAVAKSVAGSSAKVAAIAGTVANPGDTTARKRPPSEASDVLAGGERLRRKSEQVVEAHIAIGRLSARKQALVAQLESVKEAAERKSAECKRMREHLGSLRAAEDACRDRLYARAQLRMGCWQAALLASSSAESTR